MSTHPKVTQAIDAIDAYFRSGNSVQVDRATIKASEWNTLKTELVSAGVIPPDGSVAPERNQEN